MPIWLIRHGETEQNAARILQRPEVPLSALGQKQAQRLAGRLAGLGVDAIVSSDYPRAAMTAERIARASGADIEWEPLLQERDFGDWRGKSYDDPDLRADWLHADQAPPGGESSQAFRERVDRAWLRVAERLVESSLRLAVVTHGLVCRAVVARLAAAASAPVETPPRFDNTSLTVIQRLQQKTGSDAWHIERMNCTEHLAGLGE